MMSALCRNDICSSQSAGDNTTARANTPAPSPRPRRLLIDRLAAQSVDDDREDEDAGNHQGCHRAAVTPIRKTEGLLKRIIIGHLRRPSWASIGQHVDQREGLDA